VNCEPFKKTLAEQLQAGNVEISVSVTSVQGFIAHCAKGQKANPGHTRSLEQ